MIKLFIALTSLFLLSIPVQAQEITFSNLGKVRVIDGDTLQIGKSKVRAVGYDTPEVRGKCADEKALAAKATARLKELLSDPQKATLKWVKGKDKYGRSLARLYSNHQDVGPILIKEGLAHPYDGGTKTPWCGVSVLPQPRPFDAPSRKNDDRWEIDIG